MSAESIHSSQSESRPKLDVKDIHKEWFMVSELRDHLREQDSVLFEKGLSENIKICIMEPFYQLLQPLLCRMAEKRGNPQPIVDPLRQELESLYRLYKGPTWTNDEQIVHDSWMVRKLLGFVKMKTRIGKPSIAP